jgi:membrane-bound lytic murein transglycosylase A
MDKVGLYKTTLTYIFLLLFLTGCQEKVEKKPNVSEALFVKTKWAEMVGFEDDNLTKALDVFKKGCKAPRVNKNLKQVCKKSFETLDAKEFFTKNFTPYKLINKKGSTTGLITGYYEPILNGSFTKSEKYKYSVYKTPKDLITVRLSSIYPDLKKYTLRGKVVGNHLVPYESRKDLEKIKDKLEPLLYVDNKVDKFFLEIQGSGKVKLPDGEVINLAYAQQNGRKYYPIGRKLLEDGYISKKDMSLQSIKKWCDENPSKVDEVLNLNDSVVFFKKSFKTATGSLGVELVAKRNLAVDRSFIPLGFPVFINTTNPTTSTKINSLMVAADTGGAIKGDIRADFFWGNGDEAKLNAGKMAQKGRLTLLIPKLQKEMSMWSGDRSKYLKVK